MKRALLALLLFSSVAHSESERDAVVGKAAALTSNKVEDQRRRVRAGALALYRASRGLHTRSLIAPRTDDHVLLRAAWRVLLRDLKELDQLKAEQSRLAAARPSRPPIDPTFITLSANSLTWPVPGAQILQPFGIAKDPADDLEIAYRGVDLASEPGQSVSAVAAGTVLYVGPIRGVGEAILIAHRQGEIRYVSITGNIAQPVVKEGKSVERGERLARAGGRSVYLEIRVRTDLVGTPVDPAPLLGSDGRAR